MPAGFLNHGNTCYLNAVLQVLINTPEFAGRMRCAHLQQVMQAARNGSCDDADWLFCSLSHVLAEYQQHSSDWARVLSPAKVRATLAISDERWGSARQQDAHELLLAVLDRLRSEVLAAQVQESAEAGTVKMPVSGALCPDVGAFSCCLEHTIICRNCHLVNKVKEQTNHLSIPLQTGNGCRKLHLMQLLAGFFEEEQLDKQCERCGLAGPHTIHRRLRRLPRVLIIHLKRFSHRVLASGRHRFSKLGTCVDLGFGELDLAQFCQAAAAPSFRANPGTCHDVRLRQQRDQQQQPPRPQPRPHFPLLQAQQSQQHQQQRPQLNLQGPGGTGDSPGSCWGSDGSASGSDDNSPACADVSAVNHVQQPVLPTAADEEAGLGLVLLSLPESDQERLKAFRGWHGTCTDTPSRQYRHPALPGAALGCSPPSGIGGVFDGSSCSSDDTPETVERSCDHSLKPARPSGPLRQSKASPLRSPLFAAAAGNDAMTHGQQAGMRRHALQRPPSLAQQQQRTCKQFHRRFKCTPVSSKKLKLGNPVRQCEMDAEIAAWATITDPGWDEQSPGLKGGSRDSSQPSDLSDQQQQSRGMKPLSCGAEWWPFAGDGHEEMLGGEGDQADAEPQGLPGVQQGSPACVGALQHEFENNCGDAMLDVASGLHVQDLFLGAEDDVSMQRRRAEEPPWLLNKVLLVEDSDTEDSSRPDCASRPDAPVHSNHGSGSQGNSVGLGCHAEQGKVPVQPAGCVRSERTDFRLQAAVCHLGGSSASGHYVATALVKGNNGEFVEKLTDENPGTQAQEARWFTFDDERVEGAYMGDVLRDVAHAGYLLFYAVAER